MDIETYKDAMYKIAQGQIEQPKIEIESEGEIMVFTGKDARCFAIGVLTGLRANDDGISLDIDVGDK